MTAHRRHARVAAALVVALAATPLDPCCGSRLQARRHHAVGAAKGGRGRARERRPRLASAVLLGAAAASEPGPFDILLEHFDRDGDGAWDVEELRDALEARQRDEPADKARRAALAAADLHAAADANDDGLLSLRELDFADLLGYMEEVLADTEEAVFGERQGDFGEAFSMALLAQHDIDGDLSLSPAEFLRSMRATIAQMVGVPPDPEIEAWMDSVFERADLDEDGFLNRKEALFGALIADEALLFKGMFQDKMAGAIVRVMFDEVDLNQDGAIDWSEVATRDWSDYPEVIVARVRDGFAEADTSGDGRLDRSEVERLADGAVRDLHLHPEL